MAPGASPSLRVHLSCPAVWRRSRDGRTSVDYAGCAQWSCLFVCSAELGAEGDPLTAAHPQWMKRTHHREGDKALLFRLVTKGPHPSRPDAVVFALTEVYQSQAGFDDHIRQVHEEWDEFPARQSRCRPTMRPHAFVSRYRRAGQPLQQGARPEPPTVPLIHRAACSSATASPPTPAARHRAARRVASGRDDGLVVRELLGRPPATGAAIPRRLDATDGSCRLASPPRLMTVMPGLMRSPTRSTCWVSWV